MGNELSQDSNSEIDHYKLTRQRSQSLHRNQTLSNEPSTANMHSSASTASETCLPKIVLQNYSDYATNEQNKPVMTIADVTDSTTELALFQTGQMKLSTKEKEIIQQVLVRARELENKEDARLNKLRNELKRTEQKAKRRISVSNQNVNKHVAVDTCMSCGQRHGDDSTLWNVCKDCNLNACSNCIKQVKNEKECFWLCNLCQKQRQLFARSGNWLHQLKTDQSQKKIINKIIEKTKLITRTASFSQYEDIIDQFSTTEDSSSEQDEFFQHSASANSPVKKDDIDRTNSSRRMSENNAILKCKWNQTFKPINPNNCPIIRIEEFVSPDGKIGTKSDRNYFDFESHVPCDVYPIEQTLDQYDSVEEHQTLKNEPYDCSLQMYFSKSIEEPISNNYDDECSTDNYVECVNQLENNKSNFNFSNNENLSYENKTYFETQTSLSEKLKCDQNNSKVDSHVIENDKMSNLNTQYTSKNEQFKNTQLTTSSNNFNSNVNFDNTYGLKSSPKSVKKSLLLNKYKCNIDLDQEAVRMPFTATTTTATTSKNASEHLDTDSDFPHDISGNYYKFDVDQENYLDDDQTFWSFSLDKIKQTTTAVTTSTDQMELLSSDGNYSNVIYGGKHVNEMPSDLYDLWSNTDNVDKNHYYNLKDFDGIDSNKNQMLHLKRCPNFENISTLSKYESGLVNASEISEDKDELHVINDKPTRVWGRINVEDVPKPSIQENSLQQLLSSLEPEIDFWTKIVQPSESVVDTARELSEHLQLLSSYEDKDFANCTSKHYDMSSHQSITNDCVQYEDKTDIEYVDASSNKEHAAKAVFKNNNLSSPDSITNKLLNSNEYVVRTIENVSDYPNDIGEYNSMENENTQSEEATPFNIPNQPDECSKQSEYYVELGDNIKLVSNSNIQDILTAANNVAADGDYENETFPSSFQTGYSKDYSHFDHLISGNVDSRLDNLNTPPPLLSGHRIEKYAAKETNTTYKNVVHPNPIKIECKTDMLDFGKKEKMKSITQLKSSNQIKEVSLLNVDFDDHKSIVAKNEECNVINAGHYLDNKTALDSDYLKVYSPSKVEHQLNCGDIFIVEEGDLDLCDDPAVAKPNSDSLGFIPAITTCSNLHPVRVQSPSAQWRNLVQAKRILQKPLNLEYDPIDTLLAFVESENYTDDFIFETDAFEKNKSLGLSFDDHVSDSAPNLTYHSINTEYQTSKSLETDYCSLHKPFYSQWHLNNFKQFRQNTLLSAIPELSFDFDSIQQLMSSSSSSRGSYFRTRRPHSSFYTHDMLIGLDNEMIRPHDRHQSVSYYPPPSLLHRNKHRSAYDIRLGKFDRSTLNDHHHHYHHHHHQYPHRVPLNQSTTCSPYDRKSYQFGSSSYSKYAMDSANGPPNDYWKNKLKSQPSRKIATLQLSAKFPRTSSTLDNLDAKRFGIYAKDANRRWTKSSIAQYDYSKMGQTNVARKSWDYETGGAFCKVPTQEHNHENIPSRTARWSANEDLFRPGSYYSLPLKTKSKRSNSETCDRLHISSRLSRNKYDQDYLYSETHGSRKNMALSKSTEHLGHFDLKSRSQTSMQTLRARLEAAHSEFHLDQDSQTDQEDLAQMEQSLFGRPLHKYGSLDRPQAFYHPQLAHNHELTEKRWRKQVEQQHRKLLQNLISDEPLDSTWISASSFNVNKFPVNSNLDNQTLISSTLAPPIFSTATTKLPVTNDNLFLNPNVGHKPNLDQFIPVKNDLITPNSIPAVQPNPLLFMQGSSNYSNLPLNEINFLNSGVDLVNTQIPQSVPLTSFKNDQLADQIDSSDIDPVTLAAVAGAIAATAVAGSGILDNTPDLDANLFNPDLILNNYQQTMDSTLMANNPQQPIPYESVEKSHYDKYVRDLNQPNAILDKQDANELLIDQIKQLLTNKEQQQQQQQHAMEEDYLMNNDRLFKPDQFECIDRMPQSFKHETPHEMKNHHNYVGLSQMPNLSIYQKQQQQQPQHPIVPPTNTNHWPNESGFSQWDGRMLQENYGISEPWRESSNWSTLNSLKTKSKYLQPAKPVYDFPTKRLLLMRDAKERHHRSFGIGMRIVGGHIRSDGKLGAFVEEIYPSGPADQLHGEIKEGDEILEWNSIPLVGKTFEQVQAIISQVSEETELLVRAKNSIQDDEDEEDEDEGGREWNAGCTMDSLYNMSSLNDATQGLCHHHAAQALICEQKASICPHMRQHYLDVGPDMQHDGILRLNQNMSNPQFDADLNDDDYVDDDEEAATAILADKQSIIVNEKAKSSDLTSLPSKMSLQEQKRFGPRDLTRMDKSIKQQQQQQQQQQIQPTSISSARPSSSVRRTNQEGIVSADNKNNQLLDEDDSDDNCGEIELILTFDEFDQSLTVHVARARNLPPMDLNGLADPFVKIRLHPDTTEDPDFNRQTKYIPNTLSPEWKQTVVFMNCFKRTLKRRVLEVTTWDFDRLKTNDFMGQALINLGDKELLDGRPHWFKMHKMHPIIIPNSRKTLASSSTLKSQQMQQQSQLTSEFGKQQSKLSKENNAKQSGALKSRDQVSNRGYNQ